MTTTALFVELIVIGFGPLAAAVVVILAVFGYAWVPLETVFSLPVLIVFLAATYLLGIIVDRLADIILQRPARRLRGDRFLNEGAYREARSIAYAESPFRDLFEYNRTRLRIARGWVINSPLLIAASNVFIWTSLSKDAPKGQLSVFVSIALVLVALGSIFSWIRLVVADAENIETQSRLLTDQRNASDTARN